MHQWAPVDERPYAAGEIEAAAEEVIAKATESAAGSAPTQTATQLMASAPVACQTIVLQDQLSIFDFPTGRV